ncbi:MAG TPA: NAD(P)(+) transhydrogenase (Re/Si-specific) subunit alpha, partial [Burkholderiales bacterium]
MNIGIPAETRPGETRVAATPETVKKLAAKHTVVVQSGAGVAASVPDSEYQAAGAKIAASAQEAYASDIVLKVRGPQEAEIGMLK